MNKKLIAGIIIIVIIAVVGIVIFSGSSSVTLENDVASFTFSGNYTLDSDSDELLVYCGDIGILLTPDSSVNKSVLDRLYKALKSNGKAVGYENINKSEVNGFTVYEFSANPNKTETLSTDKSYSGSEATWYEYNSLVPTFANFTDMDVVKFRYVCFFNEKSGSYFELIIFTNNTNADLYSSEIQDIINGVSVIES